MRQLKTGGYNFFGNGLYRQRWDGSWLRSRRQDSWSWFCRTDVMRCSFLGLTPSNTEATTLNLRL